MNCSNLLKSRDEFETLKQQHSRAPHQGLVLDPIGVATSNRRVRLRSPMARPCVAPLHSRDYDQSRSGRHLGRRLGRHFGRLLLS